MAGLSPASCNNVSFLKVVTLSYSGDLKLMICSMIKGYVSIYNACSRIWTQLDPPVLAHRMYIRRILGIELHLRH